MQSAFTGAARNLSRKFEIVQNGVSMPVVRRISASLFLFTGAKMSARVIVLQPECKSLSGHHYAQIKSLETAIAPVKPLLCVHRQAKKSLHLDESRTLRQFSGRIAGTIVSQSDNSFVASPSSRELVDLFERIAIGPEDHLVFLSACAETALAVVQVLGSRDQANWPHCHLRFLGDERRPDLVAIAHRMLSDLKRRSAKLQLYTEFAANIRHVLKYYDKDAFELSRIPTIWPSQVGAAANRRNNGHFTVGVFGPPRRDKGKYRLVPILAEFLSKARAMRALSGITVLVQNDIRLDRALRLRASLVAKLRAEVGKVRFLPAEMSNADFISHMRQCDVVLLPYLRAAYERRGSGVIVDAVAHSVPAICQSGTAMCELIESGNGLAASNDREFAAGLLAVAKNPEPYRAAAREAARLASDWWSSSLLVTLRQVGQEKA
jgi:glycosyltransferase involved in cell wall biosynthesis